MGTSTLGNLTPLEAVVVKSIDGGVAGLRMSFLSCRLQSKTSLSKELVEVSSSSPPIREFGGFLQVPSCNLRYVLGIDVADGVRLTQLSVYGSQNPLLRDLF